MRPTGEGRLKRALCCGIELAALLLASWPHQNQATGQEAPQAAEQQGARQLKGEVPIARAGGQQLILSQQQQQIESPPVRRNELAKLERRIDWLEFELRKSLHQLQQQQQQQQQRQRSATGDNQAPAEPGAQPHADRPDEAKLAELGERLSLVEKFITITTAKMYEVEQKLAQLDKCECQMSCKWAPNQRRHGNQIRGDARESRVELNARGHADRHELADGTDRSPDDQGRLSNGTRAQLKRDGQVWRHECDICSCHSGHVSCRRRDCPAPACEDPQQVRGKCCPVCYKSCTFRGQSVRHGNKLVINSDEQMCKECLCLDGRFKCQRVSLMGAAEPGAPSLRFQRGLDNLLAPAAEDEEGAESGVGQAQLIDELRDAQEDEQDDEDADGLDDDQEEQTGSSRPVRLQQLMRKRKRESGASVGWSWAPLLCPPVECPASEQFRLADDCCTYCRGHDFCRPLDHFRSPAHGRPHARELFQAEHPSPSRCHPEAECSLTPLADLNASAARPLESVFKCECRAGFTGDGQRSCVDVDECRDERLNDCEPESTSCANLAGGYECQCRPGFKPAPVRLARNSSAPGAPAPVAVVRAGERRLLQRCVDVDECLDGSLNGCHPHAKCVNLPGSYKCHCKPGFLGNGFQCHNWSSPGPSVAAYLHRHSASASNDAGASESGDTGALDEADKPESNEIGPSRVSARVTWPLVIMSQRKAQDHDGTPLDLADNPDTQQPPYLSAQWAPLVGAPDGAHQALNPANDGSSNSSAPTFTRTMFWQPPPKLPRPRPWWAQPATEPRKPTSSANVTEDPSRGQTASPQVEPARQNDLALGSSNISSSQREPHSIQQPGSQQTAPTSQPHAPGRPPLSGYKRGTIIASATTSRRRGSSPSEALNGRAYSQHYNGASSSAARSLMASLPGARRTLSACLTTLTQMDNLAESFSSGGSQLASLVAAAATNPTPLIIMLYALLLFYSSSPINHMTTIYSS